MWKNIFGKYSAESAGKKKIFDFILVFSIFVLCLVTVLLSGSVSDKGEKPVSESVSKSIDASKKVKVSEPTKDSVPKLSNEEVPQTDTSEPTNQVFNFAMPVAGKIFKEYSADKPVYSATMDDWRMHYGIDIECLTGTEIRASESGNVTFAEYDINMGYTVKIKSNEYECVYSSLSADIPVIVGQYVQKGDKIGTLSDSILSEISDVSHLHFEMLLNDEYVNPEDYIKD